MAGNGYGSYINEQYSKTKKPKIYGTTGSQYDKGDLKERAAIRSQLANDVAYWEQKRGKKSDREKDHVAIAENYYKVQEKRKQIEKAGQDRMGNEKNDGKYSQDDRLAESKRYRDINRKASSKEYEERIGKWATSDFKKQNNYGANKGLVESDVRFRSYMDKQNKKKDSVAQSLVPEFATKKKKEKSFLDKIFDTVKGDKPSTPSSYNLSIRDGGKNKPQGKLGDSLQKSSDSVNKFNSNAVNKATGSLWENSILPMMEAFDDKDKKPSEKLKDLFTGNLNGAKEKTLSELITGDVDNKPKYELAKPDSKGAKLASDLLGYGLGGAGVGSALRTVGLGANTANKALSVKGALSRGKEGAAIGALMSGAEVGGREVGRPDEYNWKQNLAQVGIETAGGAVLDPLLAAGGAKLLNKLGQKPKGKVNFDDAVNVKDSELPFTMNEPQPTVKPMQEVVEQTAATTQQKPTLENMMNVYKGKDVNSVPVKKNQPSAIAKVDDMPVKPYESIVQSSVKKLDENGKPIKFDKNKKFNDLADEAIKNSAIWKDKKPLLYGRETLERNFEDIAGKEDAQFLKDNYVQPVRQKEAERFRFVNDLRNKVKSLGIKHKSQEDKLTQMYGEGKINLDNLKRETPNWKKVVETADWYRKTYDELITTVNKALDAAGEKMIPVRENYFPHYQEVDGIFNKIKKEFGFDVENNNLPTDINGLTDNYKPNKKWFGNAMQRKTDETTFGAIEGFDRYIEGVSQLIYHTDNIKSIRALENGLRSKHKDSEHLTNMMPYLLEQGNLMAGKKSSIDRGIEQKIGRGVYNALDTIKRRTGLNMLGYSVSSASSALIPLTQAVATTSKKSFAKGMADTVTNLVRNDGFANKSDFLTRRVGSKPLVNTMVGKIENNSMAMMEMVDRFTSQTIVRGKYNELLGKGLPEAEALRQADDWAGRIMTDRSKGQQPTLFATRSLGPLMQFQVEVNNQVSFILKDIPKNAKNKAQLASQMTQVLVFSYLYNEAAEQVLGRRPAFDPAGVAQEAYKNFTNEDMGSKEATGNLLLNTVNQLPFTSVFTGGRYPVTSALPSININNYAQNKTTVGKELIKPLKYLTLPTGGSQINKIYEGSKILKDEGVYTKKGDLKYPVENNTENLFKGLLLGKSSFPETKEYYDKPFGQRKALGSNQTQDYEYAKSRGLGKEFYDDTILKRTEDGKKDKMDDAFKEIGEIEKDATLSDKEREKRIEKILKSIGR